MFLIILIGEGSVAEVVLGGNGGILSIHLGFAVAVAVAVMVCAPVSAHLNPAVSLAIFLNDRAFTFGRLLQLWAAQVVGAFLGAVAVLGLYWEALEDYDAAAGVKHAVTGPNATAQIFATYPATYPGGRVPSLATCVGSEVAGTALLVVGVFALTDRARDPLEPAWLGFMVGQLVFAVGVAMGWTTGYAINPARDFGPRLLSALAGWGTKVFTAHDHYFVVPLLAPLLGGAIGTLVYREMMGAVDEEDSPRPFDGNPVRVQHHRLSMESNLVPTVGGGDNGVGGGATRRYTRPADPSNSPMALLLRDSPPPTHINS